MTSSDEDVLRPGLVVTLRSGGPEMTVCGCGDECPGCWCCAWYEETQHTFKTVVFPAEALEIVVRDRR